MVVVIRGATKVISKFQGEIKRMMEYFSNIANIIDSYGVENTRMFVDYVIAGKVQKSDDSSFDLDYGETHAEVSRHLPIPTSP